MSAVVFDLGNVLIEWNPRRLLSDAYIEHTHFFSWNTELDRGESFDAVVARVREQFPQFASETDAFRDRWPELLGPVCDEVVAIADTLRARGTPVYVLTNSSAETLPRSPAVTALLERFDDALISGAVGLVKPDAAIFRECERRWGLDPLTTWFVDDATVNVDGARAAGWNAVHFTDAAALRVAFAGAGLGTR